MIFLFSISLIFHDFLLFFSYFSFFFPSTLFYIIFASIQLILCNEDLLESFYCVIESIYLLSILFYHLIFNNIKSNRRVPIFRCDFASPPQGVFVIFFYLSRLFFLTVNFVYPFAWLPSVYLVAIRLLGCLKNKLYGRFEIEGPKRS